MDCAEVKELAHRIKSVTKCDEDLQHLVRFSGVDVGKRSELANSVDEAVGKIDDMNAKLQQL